MTPGRGIQGEDCCLACHKIGLTNEAAPKSSVVLRAFSVLSLG